MRIPHGIQVSRYRGIEEFSMDTKRYEHVLDIPISKFGELSLTFFISYLRYQYQGIQGTGM